MTRTENGAVLVVGVLMLAVLFLGIGTGALGSRIDIDDMLRTHEDAGDGPFQHEGPDGVGPPDLDEQLAPATPGGGPDPEIFDHGVGAPGIFTAAPGDCLLDADSTHPLPCDHPHSAEVFYTFTVEGDEYPGDDGFGTDLCLQMFGDYVGTTPDASGYGLTWLVPTRSTWVDSGDREVICLLTSVEPVTGSAYRSAELVV